MRLASPLRALVVLGAAGCGLLNPDLTRLTFDLPVKQYHFAASDWDLPATGTVPDVPCTTSADCCAVPGVDCDATKLTCDAGMCVLHKTIIISDTMDLSKEVSSLQGKNKLSDIFIKEI